MKAKYDDIIKNATFAAVAIGGGTAEAARIFSGNRWQEIGDIRNPEPNKTYTAVGTTLIGRRFDVSD